MCDKRGQFWLSRKKINRFSWKFRTIRTLVQRTKSTIFHIDTSLQVLFLNWFFDKEIEIVVAEEYKFENGAKKSCTSWKFRIVRTVMQGLQINNSPMENFSTTRTISMMTLI